MRLLLSLFVLSLASCAALEPEAPVRLSDPKLTEASGLAASRHDPTLLWLINDSGSSATLHLADTAGTTRGFVNLKGIKNSDWEDLAAFTLDGKRYLLVADIGDNEAQRRKLVLHILSEPKTLGSSPMALTVKPDWSVSFRYEDGPRDCEGIAVDTASQSILLLSKRDNRPAIYSLPLRKPAPGEVLTAERLGELAKLELPSGAFPHPFAFQPTGLDISADGRLAAVLTYRGVYLFRRATNESWAKAFSKAPEVLGAHGLSQAEALAFSEDGRSVFVTSEGKRPRLIRLTTANAE